MTLSTPTLGFFPLDLHLTPATPTRQSPGFRETIAASVANGALERAAETGAAAICGSRVVVTCDRASGHAERYHVTRDGDPLVGPARARVAFAVLAALHETLAG